MYHIKVKRKFNQISLMFLLIVCISPFWALSFEGLLFHLNHSYKCCMNACLILRIQHLTFHTITFLILGAVTEAQCCKNRRKFPKLFYNPPITVEPQWQHNFNNTIQISAHKRSNGLTKYCFSVHPPTIWGWRNNNSYVVSFPSE